MTMLLHVIFQDVVRSQEAALREREHAITSLVSLLCYVFRFVFILT